MWLQTTRELVGVSQLIEQNSQVKKEQSTVPQLPLEQENLPAS